MITLTISDEQVNRIKSALKDDYFGGEVNVSEHSIMVWMQETLAKFIGNPAFYANGLQGNYNTHCPTFELSAPIRDANRQFLPDAEIAKVNSCEL